MVFSTFILRYVESKFTLLTYLQSNQVKRNPQDSISELIIWKMTPLVVPVTGDKFEAAFLHA